MAVRLNVLVDAWRQDTRAASTVELAALLVRALAKNPRATSLDLAPVSDFAGEAIRRHERDLEPLLAVARLLLRTGDLTRAEHVLSLVARIAPEEPRLHRLTGEVRLHRGDHAGAEHHFTEAASLRRGNKAPPSGAGAARPPPSTPAASPLASQAPPSSRSPTSKNPAERPPAVVSRPSADAGKYAVVAVSRHAAQDADAPSIEITAEELAPSASLARPPRPPRDEDAYGTEVMSVDTAAVLLAELELDEDEDGQTIVRGYGDYASLIAAHSAAEPSPPEDEDSSTDDGTLQIHQARTFTRVVASLWGDSAPPSGAAGGASAAVPAHPHLPSIGDLVDERRGAGPQSSSSQAQDAGAHLGGQFDRLLVQTSPGFELDAPPASSRARQASPARSVAPAEMPAGRSPDSARGLVTQTAVPPIRFAVRPSARRWTPFVAVGVACVIALGIAGAVFVHRARRAGPPVPVARVAAPRYARVVALEVHTRLLRGGPRELAEADAVLSAAASVDGRPDAALARVRERALTVLEVDGKAAGLTLAIERARGAGVPESDLAVGEVARSVAGRDATRARETITRHDADPARAADPYWQLVVGAALDLAADPASIERYRACLALNNDFVIAEQRLVRAILLSGDLAAGQERLAQMHRERAGPASAALLGLAWTIRRDGQPPADAARVYGDPGVPRPLRAAALVVAGKAGTYPGGLGGALRASVEEADAPAMALLTAYVASDVQNRAIVWSALDRAVVLDPSSPRVAAAVGRLVYVTGTIEELEIVAAKLPPRDRAAVSALVAYEANDLAELTRLAEATQDPPPTLAAARHRLAGEEKRPADLLARLRRADVVGGDAIAVDLLLDAGDIASAREIVASWPAKPHPLRAHRRARLARYERRMDEARRAIADAAPTRLARIERGLLEAELKEPSAQVDPDLEAVRPWLSAYQHAMRGDMETSRRALGSRTQPEASATLLVRIVAGVALGALGDRRNGVAVVRPLLNAWPDNPDVIRSAVLVGLLPRTALPR